MYTTDVYKIYTKCIPHFDKLLYRFCIYKIKRTMSANFYIQNVYKSSSKCGINFVYKHFVYIFYTKVCQNVGYIHFVYKHFVYILYTKVLQNVGCLLCIYKYFVQILYTSCIQNVYKNLLKYEIHFVCKHFVYILYTSVLIYRKCTSQTCIQLVTKFIQNVYTNNCMQNGSLISIYFDPFVVLFLVNHCKQLTLETC